jgi:transposase
MKRKELTNTQWERLQPLLPPQQPKTGRPASDHRVIINGILWMLRTGAPWRDLPERYGPWGTVASRFYRWRKAGIWQRLFATIHQQADAAGCMGRCTMSMARSCEPTSMRRVPPTGLKPKP